MATLHYVRDSLTSKKTACGRRLHAKRRLGFTGDVKTVSCQSCRASALYREDLDCELELEAERNRALDEPEWAR
jgi:hypothetical protein